MADETILDKLDQIKLMAICIWAEARGQGLEGMQAVGSVILNRAAHPGWWGHDVKTVILAPKQFSWILSSDPEHAQVVDVAEHFEERMRTDCNLRNALCIAKGFLEILPEAGQPLLYSNVGRATHYHAKTVHPAWAQQMTVVKQIKDHIFYV